MCRLAIRGRAGLAVDDLEIARTGVSYTVDTLQTVRGAAPGAVLYLLVGADAAAGLDNWRDPRRVIELARVCVLTRPGASLEGVDPELLRHLLILPALTPPVSASEVRRRRRQGLPVHRLLPRAVAAYCDRHDLYLA
jgi:nicotinate-nucleotide adenylyltransferase